MKSVAALGLCLLATACAPGWEPRHGPVPQTAAAAASQGGRVRLTLKADGSQVELTHMRVEGDSILGVASGPPRRYAVATEDVQVISVRGTEPGSPLGSVLAGVGIVVIALTFASLLLLIELFSQLP